ncbi:hypothetical protein ACA910_017743 [Epithemia clementina (nom. ined.)]
MSIVCSTPGQYYYGKSYYRNSETCKAGDKAKYEIELYIPNELPQGYVPYITVDVEGYGTVESVRALDSEKLCELDDLWSMDGSKCPEPGRYQMSNQFYWGAQNDNYSYKFRPHMVVGLSSQQGSYKYNLGGANTDNCENGSFTNWSNKVQRSISSTVHTFIVTLGVMMGAAILICSGYWYIRKNYLTSQHEEEGDEPHFKKQPNRAASHMSDVAQDDDDYINQDHFKRIAMMGRERDLIDA